MKFIVLLLLVMTPAMLSSCTDSEASVELSERPPENGAQFKKGDGLSLTEEMAKSIGLRTAEVGTARIAGSLTLMLRPLPGGKEASGWLSAAEGAKVHEGDLLEVQGASSQKATAIRVEKAPFATLGDYEVTVATGQPLPQESEARASLSLPEGDEVSTIPRSALLTTAEGQFVYVKNGKFFFRMGVQVGAMNDSHVEITEGLFAGDEVVISPVMSLWMAELQVLRGGKACTCGH